ncbi:MAG: aminopeptidase [Acidiferrobacter sp.]
MRYCTGLRRLLPVLWATMAAGLSGCALPYYGQAIAGQWTILTQAQPISRIIANPQTPPALRARLRYVEQVRQFARHTLHLPLHGDYRDYVNLHRPYVVWNVFAAPPLSLALKQWCFPVVGCVAYRGYFHRAAARALAARLAKQGDDVYVAGVPAYATLGYFPDPVLNTFLNYPRTTIAHIIFHELSHDLIYIPSATTFDESFADTVASVGVRRFVRRYGDLRMQTRYRIRERRHREVTALLARCRRQLAAIYATPAPVAAKLAAKAAALARLHRGFARLVQQWHGGHGYGGFFARPFNNAVLGAFASYTRLMPAFHRLLALEDGQLKPFYAAVRWYGRLPTAIRDRALQSR